MWKGFFQFLKGEEIWAVYQTCLDTSKYGQLDCAECSHSDCFLTDGRRDKLVNTLGHLWKADELNIASISSQSDYKYKYDV
jgi:hypothetical protein